MSKFYGLGPVGFPSVKLFRRRYSRFRFINRVCGFPTYDWTTTESVLQSPFNLIEQSRSFPQQAS